MRFPVVAATVLSFALPAQVFENLGSSYERLRGINFVPNYPSLNAYIGNPAAPFPYYGVASPTAMWKFYDENGPTAAAVGQQLDWVKRTGFNAVRVFLSYPAWLHYRSNPPAGVTGNAFVNRLKHFVGQCHARGIRVMPVLWDGVAVNPLGCAANPSYTDPLGDLPAGTTPATATNISYWHRNPGELVISQILGQSGVVVSQMPFEQTDAGAYIADCISVFHDPVQNYSQALLMWDVMNEAQCGDVMTWITLSLQAIKYFAPNDPTTWGWAVTDRVPESIRLATLPECDVISLHSYTHRIGSVATMLYDASFIPGFSTYPVPYGKPVIFTEIGGPAFAFGYEDAIDYCATVPRYGNIGPPGVGFMPWQFTIGYRDNWAMPAIQDNMPFSDGAGLFYFDGEVRDVGVVQKFVQLAINHGITSGLWGQGGNPWPTAKSVNHRHFVPAALLVAFDDESFQDYGLSNPWLFSAPGVWTWDDYLRFSHLLGTLVDFGAWPGNTSTGNANPWAWPNSQIPGYQPFSQQLWLYRVQSTVSFPTPQAPGPTAWQLMIAALELQYAPMLPAGWLRPWEAPPANPNQQAHVDLLMHGFLRLFVAEAAPFIVPR